MAIEVEPSELVVEMESMPAIVANCLISGVATEVAIVSGEAPGSEAETLTTGNSALGRRPPAGTCRRTGRQGSSANDIRSVATGRRMQNSEIIGERLPPRVERPCRLRERRGMAGAAAFVHRDCLASASVWPSMTTRSPLCRPLPMALFAPSVSATSTGRTSTVSSAFTT